MPVKNITTIEHKMFGLCCIQGGERERLRTLWEQRFAKKTAFWVDAGEQKPMEIMEQFRDQLAALGISSMAGERCIVALFLDFTALQDEARMRELCQLPANLQNHFGCTVSVALQFGHLGVLDRIHNKAPIENALLATKINGELKVGFPRLYLVATPFLGGEVSPHWKAVAVLLDILRRDPHRGEVLPDCADSDSGNDVGFIRYSEFLEGGVDEWQRRVEKLTKQLGSDGEELLQEALATRLSVLEESVKRRYEVDGNLQPLHPDMYVEKGGFLGGDVKKAKKGKLPSYNTAAAETCSALEKTALRMRREIETEYTREAAGTDFMDLCAECGIGLGRVKDRAAIMRLLDGLRNSHTEAAIRPTLQPYREEGYANEMTLYLNQSKKNAIADGRRRYVEQMHRNYEAVTDEQLQDKLQELQVERTKLNEAIHAMPTAEGWLTNILYNGAPGMEGVLTTNRPHSRRIAMLLREKAYQQHRSEIDAATGCWNYWIEEHSENGIVVQDGAPMKALVLAVGDGTPEYLKELIPGEEV